jgi:peptidoglycan/LPS O-acetylase OafA/YrhL
MTSQPPVEAGHSNKTIESIDGLRGACAIYVLLLHFWLFRQSANSKFMFLNPLINHGIMAVPLFFSISGYLVFRSLHRSIRTLKHWKLAFYIRRFFRIIPLWWGLVIVLYLFGLFKADVLPSQLLFYFGFLSYNSTYIPVGTSWSLFVEEIFYMILPFIAIWLLRSRSRFILLLCASSSAILWLSFAERIGVPNGNLFIWRSPLHMFVYIALGIFIFGLELNRQLWSSITEMLNRAPRNSFDIIALVLFFLPIACSWIPIAFSVALLVFLALIPGTATQRFFDNSLCKIVGRNCYPFYLLHPFVAFLFPAIGIHAPDTDSLFLNSVLWIGLFLVYFALTLLTAILSTQLIERPMIRLGGRIIAKIESKNG